MPTYPTSWIEQAKILGGLLAFIIGIFTVGFAVDFVPEQMIVDYLPTIIVGSLVFGVGYAYGQWRK